MYGPRGSRSSKGPRRPCVLTVALTVLALAGCIFSLAGSTFLLAGCTERAPWAGEGVEHGPCFPDRSCDPGLVCVADTCVRTQPDPDAAPPRLDSAPRPDRGRPDLGDGCPTPPAPAPALSPLPSTTPHDKAALRGTAPPGSIEVEATLGTKSFRGPVVAGRFCLEVALPDVPQSITYAVVALDKRECRSKEASATTRRVKPEPRNVLAGLLGVGNNTNDPLGLLTDGKTDQWTEFSFWDPDVPPGGECDNSAYVRWALPAPARIDRVVVKYPTNANFKGYLQCWKLAGANTVAVPQTGGWTELAYSDKGVRPDLVVKLNGVELRHLALVMYEDGGSGYYETFQFAEIEAWTSGDAPPFVGCQ